MRAEYDLDELEIIRHGPGWKRKEEKAMATKPATKKAAPKMKKGRRTVLRLPRKRPRTVRTEVLILTHETAEGLAALINEQLSRSVRRPWRHNPSSTQEGVEVVLCAGLRFTAPSNIYAAALELEHWKVTDRDG